MGSQMKLWTLGDKMGVLEAIGLEVPNFPKRVSWWGSTTNHFLMGSQMKLWPLAYKMGCTKFYKRCTKFCEGCTKGSKVFS